MIRQSIAVFGWQSPGTAVASWRHEHGPAHFHAVYGEYGATFNIETGEVHGEFPLRLQSFVLEWGEVHRVDLRINWEKARRRQPLMRIAPLE